MNATAARRFLFTGSLAYLTILLCTNVSAEVEINPSVNVRETYSDNIKQNSQKTSVLVSELTPAIDILSDGARSDFNLNYQMQNLNFAGDESGGNTNHSLSAGTTNELIEDWFYLDGETSFGQRVFGSGSELGTDSLTLIDNRSDVTTLRVAPRLDHRFGRNNQVVLGYEYGQVDYDNLVTSDSSSQRANFQWQGQSQANLVNWSFDYEDLQVDRDFGADSFSETAAVQSGIRVTSELQMVLRWGSSNADIPDAELSVDGDYYSGGLIYTPSRKLQLTLFGGENDAEAGILFVPSQRSSIRIIFRDREVGLNPGESWFAAISHRTRRLNLNLGYSEKVTTEQILQVEGVRYVVDVDPVTGLLIVDPITGRPVPPRLVLDIGIADSEFLQKRSTFSVRYDKRRHSLTFSLFVEERIRPALNRLDELKGAQFAWNWQMNSRDKLTMSVAHEENEFDVFATAFDRLLIPITFTRTINESLSFSSGVSRLQQRAGAIDFDENRLFASIVKRF